MSSLNFGQAIEAVKAGKKISRDKDLTAPRITPADIEANIIDVVYFTAAQASNAEPSNDPLLSAQCLASDF